MHSIFKRFREPIFVIALLAVPFTIFFVKAKKGRDLNALDRAVIFAIAPVEKTITLAAFGVVDLWNDYLALRSVREENLALRREALKARQLELSTPGRSMRLAGSGRGEAAFISEKGSNCGLHSSSCFNGSEPGIAIWGPNIK